MTGMKGVQCVIIIIIMIIMSKHYNTHTMLYISRL